jgi:parallel beta-helix repeat protein
MKTRLLRFTVAFLILGLVAGALARPSPVYAATYTVNTTDNVIDGTCDARHCSLMEAVVLAFMHRGPDVIQFNISGPGPHIISPVGAFPSLSNPWWIGPGDPECHLSTDADCYADVVIDGTTQPGYAGTPVIVLDGRYELNALGNLQVGSRSMIKGISFINWPATPVSWPDLGVSGLSPALCIDGSDIVVEDSYFGLDPSGIVRGNGEGIWVSGENHSIRRNTISGNQIGIDVLGAATGTAIEGNQIGTDPSGSTAISNGTGILLRKMEEDSGGVFIGGGPDERNIISGNSIGIQVETNDNVIRGNYIGTNITGAAALPNEIGILMSGSHNAIGDSNLISGNIYGLRIAGGDHNLVFNNNFGIDAGGSGHIPNQDAIDLYETTDDIISANVIAYGYGNGIDVRGTSRSVISENEIHDNINVGIMLRNESVPSTKIVISENSIFHNGREGIFVFESTQSDISRNEIRDNGSDGISLGTPGWEGFSTQIKISLNSIFHNSGLGIRLSTTEDNQGIDQPVITGATLSTIDGTACPNCRVEIFLSDADPSGSGEGKKFLNWTSSKTDGTFHTFLPRLRPCDQVTATVTDELGNTSEFSRNHSVGMCMRIPPLMAWIWILVAAGVGTALVLGIVFLTRRPRHLPGQASTVGLGLLGGILGAGVGLGLLAMPFVQIQWPQGQQGGQAAPSAPACSQFIDEVLVQPEDGKVFTTGTDVLFELSPQPDPPGMQTRWFLDVTGPDKTTVSKMLTTNSINLSSLGFDPKQTGIYFWKLRGERAKAGSNAWTPLCIDSVQRIFRIETPTPIPPTATATVTPTPTSTLSTTVTPTLTATPSTPTATLLQNAYCLHGPAEGYDSVTTLFQGIQVPIEGRNQDGTWWYVLPPNSQIRCWVAGTLVRTSGNVNGLPVVEAAPLGCWVQPQQGPKKCVAPCPEGAKPGGACEP